MRLSSEQKNSYLNSGILLLTATIWGLAFIAQSVAMDVIGPLTFAGARSVLAVLALTPVVLVLRRRGAVKLPTETGCARKTFLEGGIVFHNIVLTKYHSAIDVPDTRNGHND